MRSMAFEKMHSSGPFLFVERKIADLEIAPFSSFSSEEVVAAPGLQGSDPRRTQATGRCCQQART